jgi:hypothetical protein
LKAADVARRALSGRYEETIKKPIDQIPKDIERDFCMIAGSTRRWIVDTIIKKYNRVVTPNSTSL